jgi:hypothetical protein
MIKFNFDQSKILVCYLFTKFDNKETLLSFVENYKKYDSGLNHDLLICFKLMNNNQVKEYEKLLTDIKYIKFEDNFNHNDYDLGSYKRLSEKFSTKIILFLSSHSYPICNSWLKKLASHFDDNTIIGTTASNESLFSSLKLKKIYKLFSYIYRFLKFKKKFSAFPNPHIRTSSFLIKAEDYLSFIKDKKIDKKEDTWELESGKISLTNYFKLLNFKIYIVNSDGLKYSENQWKFSETYNYLNQKKTIISDKHTRKYIELNDNKKKLFQAKTWGF